MIVADGVCRRIAGRTLLASCSIEAPTGTVSAILGPNGAGKSTLLKLLSGELAPDAGVVKFAGRPLGAWRPGELARQRAVVSQFQRVDFPFTCEEIVALGRDPHRHDEGDDVRQVAVCRALLAMEALPLRHRLFNALSGGEQQRVAIARALAQLAPAANAGLPHALLLDEPTASLDLASQLRLMALLRALARSGATIVVVLHDLNLALAWADRAVLLGGGRVIAEGAVQTVLSPAAIAEVFHVRAARHVLRGVDLLHVEAPLAP